MDDCLYVPVRFNHRLGFLFHCRLRHRPYARQSAGIFFGLMFGLGGLGSAFFGWLADKTSIEFIFQVSAFLPLLGIIAGFLPNTQKG